MSKFKVGEKARVKEDLEIREEYRSIIINDTMTNYLGEEGEVVSIDEYSTDSITYIELKFKDGKCFSWEEEMLEKPKKEVTVTINCDISWNGKSVTEEKLKEEKEEKEELIAVECHKCGKLHKKKSGSYLTLRGGVYIGESGGIMGGDKGDTYYCPDCFKEEVADKIEHYYEEKLMNCRCSSFNVRYIEPSNYYSVRREDKNE